MSSEVEVESRLLALSTTTVVILLVASVAFVPPLQCCERREDPSVGDSGHHPLSSLSALSIGID